MLLPWASLPVAFGLLRAVRRERGKALNPILGRTAMLVLLHGALFAAGLAAAGRTLG